MPHSDPDIFMAHGDRDEMKSDEIEIDLKNPFVAAVLGWLWPGTGHLYQRRYAKGILFMVCILATFFYGLSLGGGHVVYASFGAEKHGAAAKSWKRFLSRWHYGCQVCVGVPAFPALVERFRMDDGKDPLLGGWMAPPYGPESPENPGGHDQLSDWHSELHFFFEIGTLYTVVAGLLNVLAIYDAFGGPFIPTSGEPETPPPEDEDS